MRGVRDRQGSESLPLGDFTDAYRHFPKRPSLFESIGQSNALFDSAECNPISLFGNNASSGTMTQAVSPHIGSTFENLSPACGVSTEQSQKRLGLRQKMKVPFLRLGPAQQPTAIATPTRMPRAG